jgi:hypothetical protein
MDIVEELGSKKVYKADGSDSGRTGKFCTFICHHCNETKEFPRATGLKMLGCSRVCARNLSKVSARGSRKGIQNASHKYSKPTTSHKLYKVWTSMKQRCTNPSYVKYHRSGGKGVTVCNEWLDFEVFEAWSLSNGYEEGLSIDRVDVDGNYSPENCAWITSSANSRKDNYQLRTVKQYSLDGEFLKEFPAMIDAAKAVGTNDASSIGKVCRGERTKAHGYKWEYGTIL